MKFKIFSISVLFLLASLVGEAQSNKKKSKKKPKKTTEKSSSRTSEDDKNPLLEKQKKAWSVSVFGGHNRIEGDLNNVGFGLGYGLNLQKMLGHTVGLRISLVNGSARSLHEFTNPDVPDIISSLGSGNANYRTNNNPYYMFTKLDYTSISGQAVFNLHNMNFFNLHPKYNMYAFIGFGGMAFQTYYDALDENDNIYSYNDVSFNETTKTREILKELKPKYDGTFETPGDQTVNNGTFFDRQTAPYVPFGVGFGRKFNERFSLSLELTSVFTGTDLIDGYRWYAQGVPSPNLDNIVQAFLCLNIKLSKQEAIFWYTNPLYLPYKTIAENKKKLEKVDELEDKMDDLELKMDTTMGRMGLMYTDGDGDGVSDFFDREGNSPEEAIVDGAGRTIMFTDDEGNLVMVDPNAQSRVGRSGNFGANEEIPGNINGGGNNFTKDDNGGGTNEPERRSGIPNKNSGGGGVVNNYYGENPNVTSTGAPKQSFDKNSKVGRTVIGKSDKEGNLTAGLGGGNRAFGAGASSSSYGFLPAVFFEFNSDVVRQQYYPELYEVAATLKANPNLKVYVIGHTDIRGSEAYNIDLGRRRANNVVRALTQYFSVNANQLEIQTQGELDNLTQNRIEPAHSANRRVQFSTTGKSGIEPIKTKPSSSTTNVKTKTTPANELPSNTPVPSDFDNTVEQIIEESKPKVEEKVEEQIIIPEDF